MKRLYHFLIWLSWWPLEAPLLRQQADLQKALQPHLPPEAPFPWETVKAAITMQAAIDEWCDAGDAWIVARDARTQQRGLPLSDSKSKKLGEWLDEIFEMDKPADEAWVRFAKAWDVLTALRSKKVTEDTCSTTTSSPPIVPH